MKKISKKLILIFAILAFIFGLSLEYANAAGGMVQTGVTFTPYNYPAQYNYPTQYTPTVYTTPIYSGPIVIDGCNGRNTGFSTTTGQSCVGNYVPARTVTPSAPSTTTTTVKTTDTTVSDVNDNYSGLAANALFGSNSFLPSGLVQWIFFAILVVAIIFLWRYVHAEDKYMSEPMKHA